MMDEGEEMGEVIKVHNENQHVMKVRNQLEFYLGDSNLAKDQFMQRKLEVNTQIELATFLQFNRLKCIFAAAHIPDAV